MAGRILLTILLVQLNLACSTTVDIDADDRASFYNLEISVPTSGVQFNRVRFRAAGAEGEFDQTLDADERIELGNDEIQGPAEIDGNLDLNYFSIAYGRDELDADAAPGTTSASYFVGISRTNFDVELESAGTRLDSSDGTTELYLQYGISHVLSEKMDFGLSGAFSLGEDISGMSEIDLKLDYALGKNLRITGAYRWFSYRFESADEDSDIEVDFHGPMLGFNLSL